MAVRGFKKITAIYFGPSILPGAQGVPALYAIAGGQPYLHQWQGKYSAWIELSAICDGSILNPDEAEEDE